MRERDPLWLGFALGYLMAALVAMPDGRTRFPLTCLCSHFAWNPKCPIHKPVKP